MELRRRWSPSSSATAFRHRSTLGTFTSKEARQSAADRNSAKIHGWELLDKKRSVQKRRWRDQKDDTKATGGSRVGEWALRLGGLGWLGRNARVWRTKRENGDDGAVARLPKFAKVKRWRRGAPDVGGEEGTVFCKLVEGDRGAMGLRHKE